MHSPLLKNSVDVAVIGAGFSGTMVAVHLLRQTDSQPTVGLIERSSDFARGLAYRTRDLSHRLNVPAAKMGAFPDDVEDPNHLEPFTCSLGAAYFRGHTSRSTLIRRLFIRIICLLP
jgi:uncharacterized NAD(P)/FAD-binding protein YdhS